MMVRAVPTMTPDEIAAWEAQCAAGDLFRYSTTADDAAAIRRALTTADAPMRVREIAAVTGLSDNTIRMVLRSVHLRDDLVRTVSGPEERRGPRSIAYALRAVDG